jgi:hypothetical protein
MKGAEAESAGWLVAGGSCQPFSFEGDDGTVIVGSGGSAFAPSKTRTLLLKEGKLVTMAGTQGVVIETSHGNVRVPPDGATIVEQKPSGVVRIANLSGARTDVAVPAGDGQTKILSAEPGEELVIADAGLADEELIPVDGVDREPIGGAIALAGTRIEKRRFDRKMMANREQLLICNTGCFTVTMKKKFDNVKQNMDSSAPLVSGKPGDASRVRALGTGAGARTKAALPKGLAPVSQSGSVQSADLVPIGFRAPSASGGLSSGVFTLATAHAVVKHSGRAKMNLEQHGVMTLRNGETVVAASKRTVVRAGAYTFNVAPGTIALVCKDGDVVKVRNLYETSANAVQVFVGGKYVHIAVGHEVLLGPDDGSLTKALKSEPIGRRHIKRFDVAGGHSMTRCEFSLVSALQNADVLTRLMNSKSDSDREISDKLVKMAAVLTQVTAGRGAYAPVGQ